MIISRLFADCIIRRALLSDRFMLTVELFMLVLHELVLCIENCWRFKINLEVSVCKNRFRFHLEYIVFVLELCVLLSHL